jgi:tRNA (adenine57-N1/adenine58-N1)-methyltransferase
VTEHPNRQPIHSEVTFSSSKTVDAGEPDSVRAGNGEITAAGSAESADTVVQGPQNGDLALILAPGEKRYLIRLRAGAELHTHLGIYRHDDVIGRPWGSLLYSRMDHPALLLEPGLRDFMTHLKRGTQIIYPKDAAYLTYRLNLRAGSRVIEAGTGSGGLTMALAWAVAPSGRVYTYEARAETAALAQANLARVQLADFVTFHEQSIEHGFEQRDVDALFLDVREPWRFLDAVGPALKPGGYFASLVPTTNQVSALLAGLESAGFVEIGVEELLLRSYKPVPDRLRPQDMMIGHTGFLIFARATQLREKEVRWQSKERRRYAARRKMEERDAAESEQIADGTDASHTDGDEPETGKRYPRMPLPG